MTRLTWSDLLVEDITPDEFRDWIAPWSGAIAGQIAPAFVSKFGFWFLRRPEGHVELLDVYTGELSKVADSYEAFMRDVNEQWWQEIYLFSKVVSDLHAKNLIPGPGQCYAIAPHPALGGPDPGSDDPLDSRFVTIMDIKVWQSICAQLLGVGR